jgi:hypothetical protein
MMRGTRVCTRTLVCTVLMVLRNQFLEPHQAAGVPNNRRIASVPASTLFAHPRPRLRASSNASERPSGSSCERAVWSSKDCSRSFRNLSDDGHRS